MNIKTLTYLLDLPKGLAPKNKSWYLGKTKIV